MFRLSSRSVFLLASRGATGAARMSKGIRMPSASVASSSAGPISASLSEGAPFDRQSKTKPIVAAAEADELLAAASRAVDSRAIDTPCPCCYGVVHKSLGHHHIDPSLRPYFREFSTRARAADTGNANVVQLILSDHRSHEAMFSEYDKATDKSQKEAIAWKLIRAISQHGAQEEMSIYPWMREQDASTAHMINHGIKEHLTLKKDLVKLEHLQVDDPEFDKAIRKAYEDEKHHIKEEERDILPKLEKIASAAQLAELAQKFQDVKKIAPTRPHPMAPTGGGVVTKMANAGAAVVDQARDAVRGATSKH
jgi:hypothetical protein